MTVSRETGDARAWRCADLGGVELFRATVSEFAFRPHAHEEFFIALTDAGTASPVYRGDTHVVGPGDLIVMNPVMRGTRERPGRPVASRGRSGSPGNTCMSTPRTT